MSWPTTSTTEYNRHDFLEPFTLVYTVLDASPVSSGQTTSAYEILERIATGEAELARAEDELKHLVRAIAVDIDGLRQGQTDLKGSCE